MKAKNLRKNINLTALSSNELVRVKAGDSKKKNTGASGVTASTNSLCLGDDADIG